MKNIFEKLRNKIKKNIFGKKPEFIFWVLLVPSNFENIGFWIFQQKCV